MINICIYISKTGFSLLISICLASFSGYLISVTLESLLFFTHMLRNCDQAWLYQLSYARWVRLIQYFITRHFFTSVVIFLTFLWTLSNLSLFWVCFGVFLSCRKKDRANYSRIKLHLWKNCGSNIVRLFLLKILIYFLKDYGIFFTHGILQVAPIQLIISMIHLSLFSWIALLHIFLQIKCSYLAFWIYCLQPHYQVIQYDLYHSFALLMIYLFSEPCSICDLYQQTFFLFSFRILYASFVLKCFHRYSFKISDGDRILA